MINIGIKTLHKIIASQIQGFIKKIIYHDQEGFITKMQGQVNVRKINKYNSSYQQNEK